MKPITTTLTGAIHPALVRRRIRWSREHARRGCGGEAVTFDDEGLMVGACLCDCPDHQCRQVRTDRERVACATCRDQGAVKWRGPLTYWHPRRVEACPACTVPDPLAIGRDLTHCTGEVFNPAAYDLAALDARHGSQVRVAADAWCGQIRDAQAGETIPALPFLVLSGRSGTGKTHALVGAGLVLGGAGILTRYTTTKQLLADIKATYNAETGQSEGQILDIWKRAPAAVLDDLGSEQETGWSMDRLLDIVDARWAARAITLVSTNLTPHTAPEDRIWSRVFGTRTACVVTTTGPDRRRAD